MNKYKRVSIIYDRDLREVHGVNKVSEVLIKSYDLFKEKKIELEYFISSQQVIECKHYQESLIGVSVIKKKEIISNLMKGIKKILKKTILNTVVGNIIEVYLKILLPSRVSVNKYRNMPQHSDVLIFQAMHSLYYFKNGVNSNEKTILILHCMDDPLEQFFKLYPKLANTFIERIFRKRLNSIYLVADAIIFVSKKPIIALKKKYPNYANKFKCIHNGLVDSKYRKCYNIDTKINMVIVASLVYLKGHDIIIEAVKRLSLEDIERIEINIIGDGPLSNKLRKEVNEYKLTTTFKFWGNRNDIEKILPDMDVFVLPSRHEGLPISIIEAFRAGVPVVASNVGGIPEMIIDGYNGFLIDADVESLLSVIIYILNNKSKLCELGRNARKTYEDYFNYKKMIEQYAEIINNI